MKIKDIKGSDGKITFTISNASAALANLLRTTAMVEVPVMAIDEVDFYENSSSMFDEYIAHRLGMIPLKTDLKTYKLPDECCGGKCSRCSVSFTLEATGPATVYSCDLKPSDEKIKVVEGKIPIIKLGEDQKLKLECKAVLGRGAAHAKWQACLAAYKAMPVIKISKDCNKCADCVAACPLQIIKKAQNTIKISNPELCTECMACVQACEKGAITAAHSDDVYLFKIESLGNLEPKEILERAINMISDRGAQLMQKIKT